MDYLCGNLNLSGETEIIKKTLNLNETKTQRVNNKSLKMIW